MVWGESVRIKSSSLISLYSTSWCNGLQVTGRLSKLLERTGEWLLISSKILEYTREWFLIFWLISVDSFTNYHSSTVYIKCWNMEGRTVWIDLGTETGEQERDSRYIQASWVPYALPAVCLDISSIRFMQHFPLLLRFIKLTQQQQESFGRRTHMASQ